MFLNADLHMCPHSHACTHVENELIYICPVVAVSLVISVAGITHCCTLQLLDHVCNIYSDYW